jgi:predicted ABC-type ATPase
MNEKIAHQKPRLIVVAGPNGAGKTTVTEQGLAHEWFQGCEYVNPDCIARDVFGDWNSKEAVINAANLAAERREQCLLDCRSLAFETVFSGADKVDFLQRAKEQGYFIRVFFVGTSDPTINASRVARRVILGGHDVPIPKIISRYFRSIAQCAVIAPWVDRLYVYDNSVDGREPQLILRISEGHAVKTYQTAPNWMGTIVEALE